jgi:hypothetical protein
LSTVLGLLQEARFWVKKSAIYRGGTAEKLLERIDAMNTLKWEIKGPGYYKTANDADEGEIIGEAGQHWEAEFEDTKLWASSLPGGKWICGFSRGGIDALVHGKVDSLEEACHRVETASGVK